MGINFREIQRPKKQSAINQLTSNSRVWVANIIIKIRRIQVLMAREKGGVRPLLIEMATDEI